MGRPLASYPEPLDETMVRQQVNSKSSWQFRISERRTVLVFGDIVASVCAVFAGLMLWSQVAHTALDGEFIRHEWYWFLVLPLVWIFLAQINDFYELSVAARVLRSLLKLLTISGQLFLLYLGIFFLSPPGSLPRLFVLFYMTWMLLFIGILRVSRLAVIGFVAHPRRAVIVGSGLSAQTILDILTQEAENEYEVIGSVVSLFDPGIEPDVLNAGMTILGTGRELPRISKRLNITEIIVAYDEVPDDIFEGIVNTYQRGVTVIPMPVLYEQITGRIPIEHVAEHQWALILPFNTQTIWQRIYAVIKRLTDILLALIGVLVFIIFLPLIAIVIKFDSKGPIFFYQYRVGQGGKVFSLIKLRSMFVDAEKRTGPLWASADDSRVTRIGHFLRRSRLDEFPQLINVLRGEMSIVGPRPERPEFVRLLEQDIPFYRTRLVVRPGLTGWAQIRFRYGSSMQDSLRKLQYDLYYIRHQSLLLDVMIMARTVGIMLTLKGT